MSAIMASLQLGMQADSTVDMDEKTPEEVGKSMAEYKMKGNMIKWKA
jgi:hypothetical protein